MNITDYLKDFFAEDAGRKAAVPGLGVFYAEKKADGHLRILFEEVAPKGKDFINHVAFRMNVTEQEAVEVLEDWVKSILQSLKSIKVATLPGIGTFDVSDGKVNFLPSAEQDKDDRFGLEAVESASEESLEDEDDDDLSEDADEVGMEDETTETENRAGLHHKGARKKRQTMLMWIGVGGCIVIILAVLLLVFRPFSAVTDRDTAVIEDIILGGDGVDPSVAPQADAARVCEDEAIAEAFMAGEREKKAAEAQARQQAAESKPAPAPKPAAKPAPAPKPAAKPAPAPKPAPVAKPAPKPVGSAKPATLPEGVSLPVIGRFYISVGSYANLDNARRVYTQLTANEAFDVRILYDAAKNIYKVSIKDFSDKASAIRFKNDLRSGAGMDGWIYEHK